MAGYNKTLEPRCKFTDNEKCFARKEGVCKILTAMPLPRKDGTCPFYKCMKGRNKNEWEG